MGATRGKRRCMEARAWKFQVSDIPYLLKVSPSLSFGLMLKQARPFSFVVLEVVLLIFDLFFEVALQIFGLLQSQSSQN